jgi:hypothetical protein
MKTSKNNNLAIFSANAGQFPKQPISLLEIMREFIGYNICQWDSMIERLSEQTANKSSGKRISTKDAKGIRRDLDIFFGDKEVKGLGWDDVEVRVSDLQMRLDLVSKSNLPTYESVNQALHELKMAFLNALAERKFVMIEKQKSEFFEQKKLFGQAVYDAFSSARTEIKSAGNCLAMNENTAAVFHLMRAAELGMRALARRLYVVLKKNPIDSGGWDEIIKGIKIETDKRWEKYKIHPPKTKLGKRKLVEFLKFCEVARDELNVFKEIWRNNTMHAGLPYNEHEAHGVFIRVRDFMQRLSTKVSEQH